MMEGSLEALAPGLTKLLHLDLSGCELEASCAASSQPSDSERSCDAAGAALAQVLSVGSLRSLVISHNALGPSFSHRIKSALGAATQLSSLDLSGNGIGSEGCLAICSQLHPQTASSQAGIATGGSALSEGLDSCQLATLNVAGCSIGDAGFVGVCDAIERGAPLRTLDASGAGLSATGLAAGLAKLNAPGNRCRLESLNVSGSHGSFNESSVTALGNLPPNMVAVQTGVASRCRLCRGRLLGGLQLACSNCNRALFLLIACRQSDVDPEAVVVRLCLGQ